MSKSMHRKNKAFPQGVGIPSWGKVFPIEAAFPKDYWKFLGSERRVYPHHLSNAAHALHAGFFRPLNCDLLELWNNSTKNFPRIAGFKAGTATKCSGILSVRPTCYSVTTSDVYIWADIYAVGILYSYASFFSTYLRIRRFQRHAPLPQLGST